MDAISATGRPVARKAAGATLAAIGLGLLAALTWVHASPDAPAPTGPVAEFCSTTPAAAGATPRDAADLQFSTTVPQETPAVGLVATRSVAAAKGDVVRVSVSSPRDGGVAVHGLLDVRPIAAGQTVTVEFRALYSGRFPVHFHGADGSHFEIAAIEVLPKVLAAR